jgi:hypothetical protein
MLEKTKCTIKNGQSRETQATFGTNYRTETNKTKKHNTEILKDEQHVLVLSDFTWFFNDNRVFNDKCRSMHLQNLYMGRIYHEYICNS